MTRGVLVATLLFGAVADGQSPDPAAAKIQAPAATESASALVERGALDMRADPEASRRDAEAALVALQRSPDTDLEIRAHLLLCDYQADRDATAAEREVAAAQALLPQAKRRALKAGTLTCEGDIRETEGNNAQAGALYDQAVAVATTEHDDEMLAGALFSRGYLLGLQGEYTSGLLDLRRAQSLYEKLGKPRHALTALNSIAILYDRMGDFEQAKHMYAEALKAQRKAGMLREEAVTQHNLARAHENTGEWQAARQNYQASLDISRQIGYPRGQAYAMRGLAAVENALGDPMSSLATLDRADSLQRQTPDARLGALIDLTRGVTLHRLKRLADARAALERALGVFRAESAMGELAPTYAELAAVLAEMGDWRSAYEREGEYAGVTGQLLSNQLDQRFAELKVEFDTAAKEKENAALLRENAATHRALEQGQRAARLQIAVIGLTVLLAAVLASVAIRQRANSLKLRVLAMTDELTGVPNRRAALTRLAAVLAPADGAPCSTLIMDIDFFKSINDQYGHSAGDEVLKVIAHEVRSSVREPAFFGRLGGEEFLIALPATRLEDAVHVAERFREAVIAIDISRWAPDRRKITASIGVTLSRPGEDNVSSVLRRADSALYLAKRSGRNCVRSEPPTPSAASSLSTPSAAASEPAAAMGSLGSG